MSEERRSDIVALVSARGWVGLSDLARSLSVSEMTVRRDLDELTRRGRLRRVRGGAAALAPAEAAAGSAPLPDVDAPPPPPPPSSEPPEVRGTPASPAASRPLADFRAATGTLPPPGPRPLDALFGPPAPATAPEPTPPPAPTPARDAGRHDAEPTSAARTIAERLGATAGLLLDAGPAMVHVAAAMHEPTAGRLLVTRDAGVSDAALARWPATQVVLTGGQVRSGQGALTGPWAVAALDAVAVEHAVLVPSGLDERGWWCPDPDAAQWALAAAACAEIVTLVVPAACLGRPRGVLATALPGSRDRARSSRLPSADGTARPLVHRVVVCGAPAPGVARDVLGLLPADGMEVLVLPEAV